MGISSTHPYIYPTKADHRGLIQINVYRKHTLLSSETVLLLFNIKMNKMVNCPSPCGLSVITDHQKENLRVFFLSCGKKIKQLQGDRNPPGVSEGNSSFTHRFTLNKIMFFPSLNKLKSKEILLKCPVLFIRIRKEGFGRNGRIPCEISCEIKFEQVVNISLLERKSAQMGIKHPF